MNKLRAVNEMFDVSYFGKLDIANLQPEGELYVEKFILPSGQPAQGEFYVTPNGTGFSLFAPQVYLGDAGLTAVDVVCIPDSVSTDFSFSASDYVVGEQPGTIFADGSILLEDDVFLQASVSVENLHFSSVFSMINNVLPEESSLPASLLDRANSACYPC